MGTVASIVAVAAAAVKGKRGGWTKNQNSTTIVVVNKNRRQAGRLPCSQTAKPIKSVLASLLLPGAILQQNTQDTGPLRRRSKLLESELCRAPNVLGASTRAAAAIVCEWKR